MSASVSRRQADVCITVVEIQYDVRNLYVGLEVSATSDGVKASSRGSRLSAAVRFERVVDARS